MANTSPPVRQLPSLTGYRAILFVAVFITHALGAGYFFANNSINQAGTYLPYGTAALSTFFVLSGFVLTWGEPWRSTLLRFWRRRVVKIYPGHVIVWAGTLLLLLFVGPMSLLGSLAMTKPGPVVANLFLVQDWTPKMPYVFSVYGVNWSVSVEVVFYLALPLLIRPIRRIADNRLWTWFAGCAVVIIAIPTATHYFLAGPHAPGQNMSWNQDYFTDFFPLARMPEFLLGVFLARILQTGRRPRFMVWWGVLLTAALTALMFQLPETFRVSGLLTIGLCLIVAGIAARDLADKPSWLSNRFMVLLGNSSYAAYLVHFPLLGLTRHLVGEGKQFGVGTGLLIVVVLFTVIQLLGVALFVVVERPLMRRFSAPRKKQPAVAAVPA
ncbi:acyltransferase family protein [Streptomyces silvisoli]|uniref:Acyltransferase n=1 Tax=Streptomyces silvisoli TaxID=3034235 RepID=A0ABT5ZUT3_9ACTN|nr:acyltransferase [Streptomyces silvisoli]MDF3293365.1 acyltransferase [Streptomyces silvisoli]